MTLIAVFRSYDGAVICADTQETRGNYRITLDKIEPQMTGHYEVIIGGAGNVAGLVDGFIDYLRIGIESWKAGLDESGMYNRIDAKLRSYHKHQIKADLAKAKDKVTNFLYCIRDTTKPTNNIYLFKSEGVGLSRIGDYAVIGFDAEMYYEWLGRFYQPRSFRNHAILLGTHMLAFGESMVSVIRGERVVYIHEGGMKVETPSDIRELKERLGTFEKMVNQLIIKSPDCSIHRAEFKTYLWNTLEYVMAKRNEYMSMPVKTLLPMPDVKGCCGEPDTGENLTAEDYEIGPPEKEEGGESD